MRKQYDFSKGQRGALTAPNGKTRITIMLDDDVIAFFRDNATAQGMGYQTMINAALRSLIENGTEPNKDDRPITIATLREVLREELRTQ
jgi:hypothetical protein